MRRVSEIFSHHVNTLFAWQSMQQRNMSSLVATAMHRTSC